MDSLDEEIARAQEERQKMEEVAPLTSVTLSADVYGGASLNRFEGHERSIPVVEEEDDLDADGGGREFARRMASFNVPKSLKEIPKGSEAEDDSGFKKPQRIIDREDEYMRRMHASWLAGSCWSVPLSIRFL